MILAARFPLRHCIITFVFFLGCWDEGGRPGSVAQLHCAPWWRRGLPLLHMCHCIAIGQPPYGMTAGV